MEKTPFLCQFKNKAATAFFICSFALWPNATLAAPKSTAIAATNSVIDFGSFSVLPSCVNCTITVSPTGVRTASAGIVLTSAKPGQAAGYSVTCSNCPTSYTAAITPSSASLPAGGVTTSVGSFTSQQSASGPPNTLSVGATLTIPSSGSAAGTYSGAAFTITTTP